MQLNGGFIVNNNFIKGSQVGMIDKIAAGNFLKRFLEENENTMDSTIHMQLSVIQNALNNNNDDDNNDNNVVLKKKPSKNLIDNNNGGLSKRRLSGDLADKDDNNITSNGKDNSNRKTSSLSNNDNKGNTKKITKKSTSSSLSPKNDTALNFPTDDGNLTSNGSISQSENNNKISPSLSNKKSSTPLKKDIKKVSEKPEPSPGKKTKRKESEKAQNNEPNSIHNKNVDFDQEIISDNLVEIDEEFTNENSKPQTIPQLILNLFKTVITTIPIIIKVFIFIIWATVIFFIGSIRGQDARNSAIIKIKEGMNTFLQNIQETPISLIKRILLTLWCFAVIFAILSLVGIQPKKLLFGNRSAIVEEKSLENVNANVRLFLFSYSYIYIYIYSTQYMQIYIKNSLLMILKLKPLKWYNQRVIHERK